MIIIAISVINACLPSQWGKAFMLRHLLWVINCVVGLETPKHNALDLIDEDFENLNYTKYFSRNIRFLNFDASLIIYICLGSSQANPLWKITEGNFPDEGNVHHPLSKLFEWNLVQVLNTFFDLCLQIFAVGRHLLLFYKMD